MVSRSVAARPSSPIPLTTKVRATQIQYRPYGDAFDQIGLLFSYDISALDLATTPAALRLAREHNEKITNYSQCREALLSYPLRGRFPDKYHGFHSAWLLHHFPSLHVAVTTYEWRTLRPLVLLQAPSSMSILFDFDGRMLPRRPTALKAEDRLKIPTTIIHELTRWICPYFLRELEDYPGMTPFFVGYFDRGMDALDLGGAGLVNVVIHTECNDCFFPICEDGEHHAIKVAECSGITLMWEQRLYERDILVLPHPWSEYYNSWGMRRRLSNPPFGAVLSILANILRGLQVLYALLALAVGLSVWVVLGFLFFNSVSGGALLAKLGAHLHFLGKVINRLDQRLCRVVAAGEIPCIIAPNPDVAGIGGRLALYTQAISLVTLSPTRAASTRWALAVTSLAFGFSTLVSASANQLSLYHIILAAKFQSFPLILTTIVEPKSPPYREASLFFVNRTRWAVNAAIILWYSFTAPCFGVQPACNVYVRSQSYFTVSSATKMPQRLTSVINITVTLLFLANDLFRVWYKHRQKVRHPRREVERLKVTSWWELYSINWVFDNTSPLPLRMYQTSQLLPLPATMVTPHINRVQRKARALVANLVAALPYPKFQRYMIALSFAIMLVWNIEDTIALNTVAAGEKSWTYGQILAFALTVVPVVQVLRLLGLLPSKKPVKLKGS